MRALRSERAVERRGNQHLDDWFAAPAVAAGVAEGAIHVGEARTDDDARGVVIAGLAAWQGGEARQSVERDVDAERAGAAAPMAHAAQEVGIERARRDHRRIEQARVDVRRHGLAADAAAVLEYDTCGAAALQQDLADCGAGLDL